MTEIDFSTPAAKSRARLLLTVVLKIRGLRRWRKHPLKSRFRVPLIFIVIIRAPLLGQMRGILLGPVVRRPISASLRLNFNPGFFFFY